MDSQVRRARNLYRWLWFSPLLTVPTAVVAAVYLLFSLPAALKYGEFGSAMPVVGGMLISALWHLVLLIPAFRDSREFVRWHGRQALLLAALRTALPTVLLLCFVISSANVFIGVGFIGQIALWFAGTLWGQGQAASGECTLMRWAGHGTALPLKTALEVVADSNRVDDSPENGEALVELISRAHDPERRREILAQLERLGWVETL